MPTEQRGIGSVEVGGQLLQVLTDADGPMMLRDLAGSRVRYGYRRLTVLLRREGWPVNAKRIYRLYREDGLQVRTAKRAIRPLIGA